MPAIQTGTKLRNLLVALHDFEKSLHTLYDFQLLCLVARRKRVVNSAQRITNEKIPALLGHCDLNGASVTRFSMPLNKPFGLKRLQCCLLYTSDAADE